MTAPGDNGGSNFTQGYVKDVTGPPAPPPPPGAPPLPLPTTGPVQTDQGKPPPPPPPDPQEAANAATAAGGNGYVFDAEGAQKVIDHLKNDTLPKLVDARREARKLINIKAPGNELASQDYVGHANDSGQAYINYIEGVRTVLDGQIHMLEQVRDKYLEQEQGNAEALGKGKNT